MPTESAVPTDDVSFSGRLLLDDGYRRRSTGQGTDLGQQLLDVSHYLFRDHSNEPLVPASTGIPWERLFSRMGEILFRVLAPGTSRFRREELVNLLRLWLQTDFPSHLGRLRWVDAELAPNSSALIQLVEAAEILAVDDRCFIHCNTAYRSKPAYREGPLLLTLEKWADTARVIAELPIDLRFDAVTIESTLSLLKARGPVPFDIRISQAIAEKTGLSVGAASLAWTAGYEPWMIGMKKRAEYGIDRPSLDRAERELMPLRLRTIYSPLMPTDPASLYDGASIVQRFVEVWPPPARVK